MGGNNRSGVYIWRQRSRINAIRLPNLSPLESPWEFAVLTHHHHHHLPSARISSVIQSAEPQLRSVIRHRNTKKPKLERHTADEREGREKEGEWHMGAKHNQMADVPAHEKWQRFGARMNY